MSHFSSRFVHTLFPFHEGEKNPRVSSDSSEPTRTTLDEILSETFPDRRKEKGEGKIGCSDLTLRAIENVKDYRVVVEPSLQQHDISGELNFPEINYILFLKNVLIWLLLAKFGAFTFFFFLDTSKFCKL